MPDISDETTRVKLGAAMACATDPMTIASTLEARALAALRAGAPPGGFVRTARHLARDIRTAEAHGYDNERIKRAGAELIRDHGKLLAG